MAELRTTRRHPLCPGCRYDLVATVDAGGRPCPECGREFEMGELLRARRPGDWTIATGLANATKHLLVRGVIALPAWFGVAWAVSYLLAWFPFNSRSLGGVAVILALPGIAIGHALAGSLVDAAGFTSWLLVIMAAGTAAIVVIAGVLLAGLLHPMPIWSGFVMMATWAFATGWCVRTVAWDS